MGTGVPGIVSEMIRRDKRFRRALPPGFATCDNQRRVAQAQCEELWSVLTHSIDPADLISRAVSTARLSIPPRLEGHLLDLDALEQIDQNTRLRIRRICGLSVEEDDTTVRVTYHGKV